MLVDEQMNRFRLASRNTYNHFFHLSFDEETDCWHDSYDCFADVENALFNGIVIKPCNLIPKIYGEDIIDEIGVRVSSEHTPVMINRHADRGKRGQPINYWDHPVTRISSEIKMSFISFFDFDGQRPMDNQYAEVVIVSAPPELGIVGRRALIEVQYIEFTNEKTIR